MSRYCSLGIMARRKSGRGRKSQNAEAQSLFSRRNAGNARENSPEPEMETNEETAVVFFHLRSRQEGN